MRLGSIDIGSSSIHLWVVDVVDGAVHSVHLDRAGVRLGGAWDEHGPCLQPAAVAPAIEAMHELVSACRELGCDVIRIAATAAVRDASDQASFCAEVHARTGVPVRVLSGEDEARLSYLGVRPRLQPGPGPDLVFDLGGGSTEFMLADCERVHRVTSVPLGHLATRKALGWLPDPPGAETTARLRALAVAGFGPVLGPEHRAARRLVGTSGTVWTVSRVVEGLAGRPRPAGRCAPRLARAELAGLVSRLEALPQAELDRLPEMDLRRRDSFYVGAVLVLALLDDLDRTTLWTAEGGVREGLVTDFVQEVG